jgi:hypothetical protein
VQAMLPCVSPAARLWRLHAVKGCLILLQMGNSSFLLYHLSLQFVDSDQNLI